ncbi:hypothetical protein [Fimbriiglobus ruber]|uniref:hypothetical protein n=1 Tax=Fimbriiglobus ruber TaxID=1908690 RepID=UPI000B4BE5F8|nr:hypothetical protein [Fimbriiglobus ruber]
MSGWTVPAATQAATWATGYGPVGTGPVSSQSPGPDSFDGVMVISERDRAMDRVTAPFGAAGAGR